MARYLVEYPIAGSIHVEVEADSRKEAIDKAFDAWEVLSREEQDLQTEWEWCNPICEGNVLHAPCNEAMAELLGDKDPDA